MHEGDYINDSVTKAKSVASTSVLRQFVRVYI
jgi:hypothetical protein